MSAPVFKHLELRCDLLVAPADPEDLAQPYRVFEFQLYHDHSALNRAALEKQLVWRQVNPSEDCRRKGYRPRRVEAYLVLGSQDDLPGCHEDFPEVRLLFLDEMLKSLAERDPESPLAAALAPLLAPLDELERDGATLYGRIRQSPGLHEGDRQVLNEVFLNLFLQRFKTKTREQIRKMIAELIPLKETRAGQELYEEGLEEGIEKGEQAMAIRLLGRKFPAITDRARSLVESLSSSELLSFGEALLFFETEEDCLAWLERRG